MSKFQPKDLVAVVTLIGLFLLKARGVDGNIDTAGALILGYYFAHRMDKTDPGV